VIGGIPRGLFIAAGLALLAVVNYLGNGLTIAVELFAAGAVVMGVLGARRMVRSRAPSAAGAPVASATAEPVAIPSSGPVIEAASLLKRYGDLTAVDGVSFTVQRGEIFGILGPNGAGKTTTLEMLEGLRTPDGGKALVLGLDMTRDARKARQRIGVQLQATALPNFTTVVESIDLFASFYDHARPTSELLKEFDLEERAGAQANMLSGGQQQRLSIALAVVNDPELVFLDEPTTGLDPQARLALWGVIEKLRQRGRTVILTTHYMEEAERLCDRVAVMDRGLIVALDTPAKLIAQHGPGMTIQFTADGSLDVDRLRATRGADSVDVSAGRVRIRTRDPESVLAALLASGNGHLEMTDLRVDPGTLEDVFLSLTGRELRQ
jgi:ABC-2 type transport system ATP-binding protein